MMETNSNDRTVVVLNATIYPYQKAALDSHAKAGGFISRSAALRDALDDWLRIQARRANMQVLTEQKGEYHTA